jgi:proline iminopeptidase
MIKKIVLLFICTLFIMSAFAQESFEGSFIDVNGKKLWYHKIGQGEPLLLVPGGGAGSHHYFRPYFDELAEHFTLVYFDSYGRGHSERAKNVNEYSFTRDIDEIEALRKALKLGKINIMGQSFSGLTVQAYVSKYPESVNKVILMNPLINGDHYQQLTDRLNTLIFDMFPEIETNITNIRAKGIKSSAPEHQEAFLSHFADIFNYFYWHNSATAPQLRWDTVTFNAPLYYKLVGEDADFVVGGDVRHLDFQNTFAKTSKPALIISGRSDQVVIPREVFKFYKRVGKQAQLVFMENSGHFPWMEEKEATFEHLRKFLIGER